MLTSEEDIDEIARRSPQECSDLQGMPKPLRMALNAASAALWLYNAGKGPAPRFPDAVRANVAAFCEAAMRQEIEDFPE